MTTLSLRATIASGPAALELRYRLDNPGERGLAIYNHLFKRKLDGALAHRAALAYIDLDGSVTTGDLTGSESLPVMRVQKRRLPYASGPVTIEAPHLSYLPGGAALEETIVLPLPICACNPARRLALLGEGGGADVVADLPRRVARVDLVIEAYPVESLRETLTLIKTLPGRGKVYRSRFPTAQAGTLLTATAALPAPIEALDYRLV